MNKDLEKELLEPKLKEIPFKRTLSFRPVIELWEKRIAAKDPRYYFAKDKIEEIKKIDWFVNDIDDYSPYKKYKDEIDLLMSAIYSPAEWDTSLKASLVPFDFIPVYKTELFDNKIGFTENVFKKVDVQDPEASKFWRTIKGYFYILHRCYNVELNIDYSMVFNISDPKTNLDRFYQFEFDGQFLQIKVNGELPELTEQQVGELLNSSKCLEKWFEYLPPEKFEFFGFSTVTAIDVTNQEVLSHLKYDLLERESIISPEKFKELEHKLRSFFKKPNLKLGLAALHDNKDILTYGRQIGNSFVLNDTCNFNCSDISNSIYEMAAMTNKSVIIDDLLTHPNKSIVEKEIERQGIRSLVAAPLFSHKELIGFLELGSSDPKDFTSFDKFKIKEVSLLFSIAIKRILEETENKIQAIIKEECTAIHPTVEWRFLNAAVNLLGKRTEGLPAEMENIIFENVYPLYAVTDIRNSSLHRNRAIQEDLAEHLKIINNILLKANSLKQLPILEEMIFRVERFLHDINNGLSSGAEVSVSEFIQNEVESIFAHLKKTEPDLGKELKEYESKLDKATKSLYVKRGEYEEAVSTINDTISSFLDDAEIYAQKMFPHYFEKYKTDGVEHGIYIGESLVKDKPFDKIYLHNLRLWQLIAVCEIARKTGEIRADLKVDLETTHLILVQNTPLAIRFRMDEKKFDVDGTYNIRYEIMKKRIDKALILGTNERLTQPGKIAIVYSQGKEAYEYKKYIEYLQAKNVLLPETEEVLLETLQGVQGLRALRVTVNQECKEPVYDFMKEEFREVVVNANGKIS